MPDESFRPTVYLLDGCPFCFKVRLFLLESGLQDAVEIKVFPHGGNEEARARAEVAPHVQKMSFPAARLAPDRYMTESDAIIEALGKPSGARSGPVLQAYVEGPFKQMLEIYREHQSLKARLAELGG